jgi:hypothetical protein
VFINEAVYTDAAGKVAKEPNGAIVVAATGFGSRLIRGGSIFLANTGIANFAEFAVCIHDAIA